MFKTKIQINKWKIACYLLAGLFFIAVIFSFIFLRGFYGRVFSGQNFVPTKEKEAEKEIAENKCAGCVRRLIDGVWAEPGQENLYPAALIIDNLPEARPAFGLSRANLVYEAEAEGGITRYLAIFAGGEEIEKIGPVRSVRPYFLDWAEELGAVIVHCGGSPEALARIIKEDAYDLNEFYQGHHFWRDRSKLSPHNIFTSTQLLSAYSEEEIKNQASYFSWKFKDPAENIKEGEVENLSVKIGYYSPVMEKDFTVEWKYDIIDNKYIRYLGGDIHKTAGGEIITARNIIVQFAEAEVIDNALRLKMKTIGNGKAVVCLDGKCRTGEWVKKTKFGRTRYYYENGEEAEFNAGATWVEVVRPEREVVIE